MAIEQYSKMFGTASSSSQQQTLLAIMEFMNQYDESVNMANLFNGASFSRLLRTVDRSFRGSSDQVDGTATRWNHKLSNAIHLMEGVSDYVAGVYGGSKRIQCADIDVVSMCKYDHGGQLEKFFELVMAALLSSDDKDKYVQTIMSLEEGSQECFIGIIKNAMETRIVEQSSERGSDSHPRLEASLLLKVLRECEEDIHSAHTEAVALERKNREMTVKVEDYEQTISKLEEELSNKQSVLEVSSEESGKIQYLEDYVEKLKEKLLSSSKQAELRQYTLEARVKELEGRCQREAELEKLANLYKDKYEDMIDQVKKISIWKKEKTKFEKMLSEKEFVLQKLQERVEELTEKNIILEENELDIQMQLEKKNINLEKMNEEINRTKESFMALGRNNTLNSSFLLGLQPGKENGSAPKNRPSLAQGLSGKKILDESNQQEMIQEIDECNEQVKCLKKHSESLNVRIKQLEKELARAERKCERVMTLEEEKKKLQNLVYELRMMKSEEINLLVSALGQKLEDQDKKSKANEAAENYQTVSFKRMSKKRMPPLLLDYCQ